MTEPALTPRGRSAFDRFAEEASNIVSGAPFFAACALVVLLWLPTILVFEDVATWQLVINTATSVLAFLLVALLQNSERRYDRALHYKVDAVARGLVTLMRDRVESEPAALERSIEELCSAVGLEQR